jgi:serine/threonine protein phosphatase PrpC
VEGTMNLRTELIYERGFREINEDAYVINEKEKVLAVIDGATGLSGLSGKLAAETIQRELEHLTNVGSLRQTVLHANRLLGEKAAKQWNVPSIRDIPKEQRSSCGMVAVKISGHTLDYVHAGDCMLFLQYKNGTIRSLTYDHLFDLDSQSIEAFQKEYRTLLDKEENPNQWDMDKITSTFKQIRSKIRPILETNRRKLNTIDGYHALDGSDEAENFLEHGKIFMNKEVKAILLLSDGLQLINIDGTGMEVWHETAQFAFTNGLKALRDKVCSLEAEDPACFTYPRLKPSDDKTGILIHLI